VRSEQPFVQAGTVVVAVKLIVREGKVSKGVRSVDNQIEVLPLSRFDNDIRLRTYRAIYGYGPLNKYILGVRPSIHILVKDGNVTLSGVVDSKFDHDLAYVRANGVAGSFSVKNELQINP